MLVSQSWLAGAGFKTPQAALVKSSVVSVEEKACQERSMSVVDQREERKRTANEVSKLKADVETGGKIWLVKTCGFLSVTQPEINSC